MKVLITGGGGFIGSHLADRLLARGDQVLVIDNFATGRRDNLPTHPHLTVVEGTIADAALVDRLCAEFRPELLVHAAASYKNPANWQEDIDTNVLGTVNIVQACRRHMVPRVVYLQTALCYGRPRARPIPLTHPLEPFTSYAVTKTAGEQYVMLSGLSYVSLRLANVYGPRHFSGPMPTFYKQLKAGQQCTVVDTRRDFLALEDFLQLMDTVIVTGGAVGCFNVSSGRDTAIKDVFLRMTERMKIRSVEPPEVVPPGADDVASLLLDPSETERVFGWKACVPLDAGIDRLVAWYDTHPVDTAYTHLRIGQ